jgi:hypothetical protein
MPKDYGEQIEKLKSQREKIERRLNTLEQKAIDKGYNRDTRRKIILGGAVLAGMQKDADFANVIRGVLARYVERPKDREVIADLLQKDSQSIAPPVGLSDGGQFVIAPRHESAIVPNRTGK